MTTVNRTLDCFVRALTEFLIGAGLAWAVVTPISLIIGAFAGGLPSVLTVIVVTLGMFAAVAVLAAAALFASCAINETIAGDGNGAEGFAGPLRAEVVRLGILAGGIPPIVWFAVQWS